MAKLGPKEAAAFRNGGGGLEQLAGSQASPLILPWIQTRLSPLLTMVILSLLSLALPYWGRPDTRANSFTGNGFAWACVTCTLIWAALSLKLTRKTFLGSSSLPGFTPEYAANGIEYYIVSMITCVAVHQLEPGIAPAIYNNMPEIIAALSYVGFVLCTYLYIKGKYFSECDEKIESMPLSYEFYRGMEIHPTILGGIQVKQFIGCRFALIVWPVLSLAFLSTRIQLDNGELNHGMAVNVAIQFIYLFKFFCWETGYLSTIDMTDERSGYYLIYTSMVFVPAFFPFSSYWFVSHPPQVSPATASIIFTVAMLTILVQYRNDYEKQVVRAHNGDWSIYGKPAQCIDAKYLDAKGDERTSKLLICGLWGVARHLNYTCELIITFCVGAPGLGLGSLVPFSYFIFMILLKTHRILRDEEKCSLKYGKYWEEYCQKVPYRLIPYVF